MSGQTMDSSALFDKCAETKLMKDGTVQIHCKRALWSVSGHDRGQVEREARHYWFQYWQDGEYDSLLPNARSHDPSDSEVSVDSVVGEPR